MRERVNTAGVESRACLLVEEGKRLSALQAARQNARGNFIYPNAESSVHWRPSGRSRVWPANK
jgi:hypothetical protein